MTAQLSREELQRIADTDHVQCGDAAAMARMLLAGMGSEPVAWWTGPEPTPTGEIESIHDHETGSHSIPLFAGYTAPPAPVAVPDECTSGQAFISMRSKSMQGNYMDGWNDCRAAMLKGENHEQ